MQRRAETRRIQQLGKARGVAIEIGAEQDLHAADGAVSLRLVEELVYEAPQLALVTEEPLQGARQAAFSVREVLTQQRVQGCCRPLVRGLRLAEQPLELGPDGVHVDRDADALDRGEPNAQRPLHQHRPLFRRPLRHEGREGVVVQHQVLDDQPI